MMIFGETRGRFGGRQILKMMLLSRPVLCAYATRFFFIRCHHYQSQPQPRARLILPVTQFGGIVKPLIHTVGSRSISAGVTNDRPIDSPLMQSMETKIKDQLDAELVTVKDAYGDGRHVRKFDQFENLVLQH